MTTAPDVTTDGLDSTGQQADILALPDHLRDALWRVESARIGRIDADGLVVCGVGGSGVGGVLARAALGQRLHKPFLIARDYEMPAWTPDGYAVLCASYSGLTEETLACFEAAEDRGMDRVVATTGGPLAEAARDAGTPVIGIPSGMQPRAAVGYLFTIACQIAAVTGVADDMAEEIEAAADHLERRRDHLGELAVSIAERLEGSIPLVYGNDLTAPVAYRWKTQINENAEMPAFSGELPEVDHNEIMGWSRPLNGTKLSAVFLTDRDQNSRQRRRIDLTASLIEPRAGCVLRVETEGETRAERLLWAVMLGDLVSLQLARLRGVDPAPIGLIDQLKSELDG